MRLNWMALLLCLGSAAHAALSPINVTNVPLANGASAVVVSGKHLYIAGSGFQVFDISSPANPTYEGQVNIAGGAGRLAVWGDYAYVTEGNAGTGGPLHIIDISDPANPVDVGLVAGTWGAWSSLITSGGLAYLGGSDGSASGVFIYDLSVPTSPTQLGRIDTFGPFDVFGQYVYVATPDLHIWDASNPTLPIHLGQVSAPTALAYAVAVNDGYAFVATGTNGLPVYNVADPAHPAIVADPSCWTGLGIAVSGNYAFPAWGSVFVAFDVSNPTNAAPVCSGYSPFAPFGGAYPPGKFPVSRGYMFLPTYAGLSVWSLGVASPPMAISVTATNTVLLSWHAPTAAFSVEENDRLNTTGWTALTNIPVVAGSQNQVAIPPTASNSFYRLVAQ